MSPRVWHEVRTSSNRTSLNKFSVFLCLCVCVFNCCRQQTVIPLSLPCVYVCVSPFFFLPGVGKCRTACLCVSVCVWEMFGGMPFDTERLLEMQFPPFLYMGVFMLGFIRIWKCCAAVPGLASPSVRSCSLALPFARALASSVSPAGSCIRDEGLERRGRPTAYTGKLNITNRINTPRGSLKSVCVTGYVGGDVGIDECVFLSFNVCFLKKKYCITFYLMGLNLG